MDRFTASDAWVWRQQMAERERRERARDLHLQFQLGHHDHDWEVCPLCGVPDGGALHGPLRAGSPVPQGKRRRYKALPERANSKQRRRERRAAARTVARGSA